MFDHIGIRVKDLAAAVRLYKAVLAPLGHTPEAAGDGYAGFGALWLHQDPKGGGAHVAFSASSRVAVDAFHKAGLEAGARDNGKPGLRTDYSPTYYAAFLVDLDGNNLEAVCTTSHGA